VAKRGKEASADAAGKGDASASPGRRAEPAGGAVVYSTPIGDAERLKILDAILDNMNEGLFLIDEDFKYVLINPASGRILVQDPKQWIGKRAGSYVHPDDRVKSHETVMRTIQGENSSCEVRVMGSDGRYKHLEMHYSLIIVGETFYILGLVADITNRKRTEDELRASEEKYRTLVETQSVAIMTLDLRGSILFANDNFQNVFGYLVDDAPSLNLFNLMHPDDVDRAHRQISQASRGKRNHNMEYRMMTKCGAYVPVLVSASPIIDKNGKVVSIICTANDITDLKTSEEELKKYRDHLEELVEKRTAKLKDEVAERKKANEELKTAKGRLEYILGATQTGFDIVDADYNVVYVDPAWSKTLGDYRGKKCHEYFMGIFEPCETCAIKTALETKKTTVSEEYLTKENRHIEVHTIPFQGEDGMWLVAEFNIDVTERKKADAALLESQKMYNILADNITDVIFMVSADFELKYISPSITKLAGYTVAESLANNIEKVVTPESLGRIRQRLRDEIKRVATKGSIAPPRPSVTELEVSKKDGKTVWVESVTNFLWSSEGKFQGFIGTLRDISDRRKAEGAFRESETKFRELADNSPNMIFINRMGKVAYANRMCSEVMGYAPEEFLADGFDFLSLVAPEDRKRVQENAKKRFDGVEGDPYEYTLLTKDKKRFEVLINSKPIMYEGQHAILGIITDISQLKRVTTDLAEARDTEKNILKMMPDAVIISDLAGKITYVSEKALEISGYSSLEDVGSTNFIELIAPEDHERAFDDLAHLLKSEKHLVTRYTLLRKDGSRYHGEVSSALLKSAVGKARAILGIVRDISDSKKMEDSLRESEEKYRNLVERANDSIIIIKDGRVVYANTQMEKFSGYSVKEIIGQDFLQYISQESKAKIVRYYKDRMAGKPVPSIYEAEAMRKDGTIVPIEINAGVINYAGAQANLIIIRDLTERKKAESQYRATIDAMSDAIHVIDRDMNITMMNKTMTEWVSTLGLVIGAGSNIFDAYPFLDREQITREYEYVFESGDAVVTDEENSIHGRKLVTETRKMPIVSGGKVVQVITIVRDITERKKSEKEILYLKEFNENVILNSPIGIMTTDMDGNVTLVNRAMLEILGSPGADKTMSFNILQLKAMVDHGISKLFQDCLVDGKKTFIDKIHYKTVWGKDIDVSIQIVPLMDTAGGRQVGSLALVDDLTETVKVARELVASEAKLHNVMQSMDDQVFGFDTEGKFNFYHSPKRNQLYAPPEVFLGKQFSEILPPHVAEPTRDALEKAKKGEVSEYEYWLDIGETRMWFVAKVSPNMQNGQYNGAVAVVRDVTEKKAAEESLRSSEEQLKALFHASIDGIGVDNGGRFAYVNPSFASMHGYPTPEELYGTSADDLIAPEDRKRMAEYSKKRLSGTHAPNRYQYKALRKDGSSFDAEISISQYLLNHELYIVGFVKDVTEQKIRQDEIVKRQVLEAQFKLKSVLTDIVPVMLNSMSKDGRADLVEKLSERLDKVLLEKYPADAVPQTIHEVANAYSGVLTDLGGSSKFECSEEERCKVERVECPEKCSVRITACPWENQKSRNLLLCILCRGIAWRFASRAKKPLDVRLEKTMADGERECLMSIETEKD
jgi:PAS domain S-box-containing protein